MNRNGNLGPPVFVDSKGQTLVIRIPPNSDVPCTFKGVRLLEGPKYQLIFEVEDQWLENLREATRRRYW